MQEKQPLQNVDNFLRAYELNKLLYLKLLPEMPSSVESQGFFLLHMEDKHWKPNGIIIMSNLAWNFFIGEMAI